MKEEHHQTQAENERVSRHERRRQKRSRRMLGAGGVLAAALIVSGWTYLVQTNDDSPEKATTSVEKPKEKVEEPKAKEKEKKPEAKKEEKKEKPEIEQAAWVKRPFANVFASASGGQVVYKADLGDVYQVLETEGGMVHLQLTDAIDGWMPESDVSLDAPKGASDEELLGALAAAIPNQPIEQPEQYLGKPVAEFEAKYGKLGNTQQDAVNTYYFSNAGYLLVVSDGVVEAIDWMNVSGAQGALQALDAAVETEYGTWYEGEKLQLKAFPDNGSTRVRLARDPGK